MYSDFLTGETSPLWALAVAIQLVSLRTSAGPQWQPGSLALRCNFWLLTLHTGFACSWCWDGTYNLTHARQELCHKATAIIIFISVLMRGRVLHLRLQFKVQKLNSLSQVKALRLSRTQVPRLYILCSSANPPAFQLHGSGLPRRSWHSAPLGTASS